LLVFWFGESEGHQLLLESFFHLLVNFLLRVLQWPVVVVALRLQLHRGYLVLRKDVGVLVRLAEVRWLLLQLNFKIN